MAGTTRPCKVCAPSRTIAHIGLRVLTECSLPSEGALDTSAVLLSAFDQYCAGLDGAEISASSLACQSIDQSLARY